MKSSKLGNLQRVTTVAAAEALQRRSPIRSALLVVSATADPNRKPTVIKTLIAGIVLALGLATLSTPGFAGGYVVNGQPASLAETRHLGANGVQPGAWVVNGYGIAPAGRTSFFAPTGTESSRNKCYYVLDVLLCD